MIEDSDRFVDELKDKAHDLYKENKELKSRIEKAIEYIKENTSDGHIIVDDLNYYDVPELLRILQGVMKSE